MGEVNDPLLQDHTSVSTQGYQFATVAIPKRVVQVAGAYISLVWEIGNIGKTTSPREVIENVQQCFADDSLKTDKLWKQKCAATLRELVDGGFEANCHRSLKFLPKRGDSPQVEALYEAIRLHKEFLNEYAHLKDETSIKLANQILNRTDIALITEEIFDEICNNFIYLLYNFFKDGSMKGN